MFALIALLKLCLDSKRNCYLSQNNRIKGEVMTLRPNWCMCQLVNWKNEFLEELFKTTLSYLSHSNKLVRTFRTRK